MKTSKKILALLLAVMMVLAIFAACDNNSSASSSTSEPSADAPDSSVSEPASEPEASDTGDAGDGEVHPCRIVQPGTHKDEYEIGIAAVNEKLLADGVGIEVSVTRIPWDAYAEKLNLMLTTGEEFELLHVMQDVKNLSAIAGMDAILSLEGLVDKYPDLIDKFTELEWAGTLYKGERFAVPCSWRSFDNVMSYMNARTDVMEKVGYSEFPSESTEDLMDMMKKMQESILEETGVKAYHWYHQNQDTAHWLHRTYDTYPFYVENSLGIVLARQDGTIDSFYESEEFKQDADYYYELFQAGLINPDILNLDSQVKYDQANLGAFLPSQTYDPYQGVTIKTMAGIDTQVDTYRIAEDKPDIVYTYVQNLNAISSTSEDPESGLKLLNWLYSSLENHDLFHYGIEGQHYEAIGDDRIKSVKDENDQELYVLDTWMTGYMPFMRYQDDAPDSQIDFMTYKSDNYVVSPIAGFIFDSSNVTTELTNLQTEIIASIYPIKVGMVSYDDNIDAAIEKLKAAGLDAYMEEYRSQFTAYLEANPQVMEMATGSAAE